MEINTFLHIGLLMTRGMYNTKFVTTKPPAANVGGDEMQFAVIKIIKLSCITFVCQQNRIHGSS